VTDEKGIRLSAENYDYGEIVIGSFQQFVLTIFNESNVPVNIERIAGLPARDFKLSNPPVMPFTIPPNGSQFLTVIFTPLTAGEKNLTFSLTVKNHQQKLVHISLRGTALAGVKGYFLPPDQLTGFAKLSGGKVCPCCHQGEVAKEKPRGWMRLVPAGRYFKCWVCGARFLTIGDKGKILKNLRLEC